MGLFDAIGGLFGADFSNPNEWAKDEMNWYKSKGNQFLDPNNSFYKTQRNDYFKSLNRSLNNGSTSLNNLLALATVGGRSKGAATTIANIQNQATMKQNSDTASNSALQFNTNMTGQGLNFASNMFSNATQYGGMYGQGQIAAQQSKNGFINSMLGLGGGLLTQALAPKPESTTTTANIRPGSIFDRTGQTFSQPWMGKLGNFDAYTKPVLWGGN